MTTFTGSAEGCSTGDEDKPAGNETGVGKAGAMCWQGRQAGLRSAAGIPWVKAVVKGCIASVRMAESRVLGVVREQPRPMVDY